MTSTFIQPGKKATLEELERIQALSAVALVKGVNAVDATTELEEKITASIDKKIILKEFLKNTFTIPLTFLSSNLGLKRKALEIALKRYNNFLKVYVPATTPAERVMLFPLGDRITERDVEVVKSIKGLTTLAELYENTKAAQDLTPSLSGKSAAPPKGQNTPNP